MISTTDQLSFSPRYNRGAQRPVRAVDWNYFVTLMERFCAPMPTEEPFDWAVANLVLDDPEVKGPFNPEGRQYLRDIINDNNDPDCREQTLITGTGVGKTLTNIAGIAWKIVHHPARGLMVMPATKGEGGSETFVGSRLIPALEKTKATSDLMPDGQRRLFMNSKKVRLNGSHFGFVGANSSSQIASNRCGDIRMDEADKFKGRLGNEAGTASLVKERIEGVADYQIFLNTTPTIETGLGWKNLLRSDFRRRFLPCPHCNPSAECGMRNAESKTSTTPHSALATPHLKGWFVLGWSEQYSVLPTKFHDSTPIPTAFIQWDTEAKRRDGSYDMDRVFRSTRLVCPHCQGHVRDEHKIWMDAHGIWLPTQQGTPHHKGYHLSSLYAPPIFSNENSLLGGRALKFLNAQEDGEGMKGFINSTLAEVDTNQEHTTNIELGKTPIAQTDWIPLLTADFQKNHPYLWFIVRKWCAFKLLPPGGITDGLPDFVRVLDKPGNEIERKACTALAGNSSAAWTAIGELLRFEDPRNSAVIEFLIAKKITGNALNKIYREDSFGLAMDFRRVLYRELSLHLSDGKDPLKIRAPRGGDSELVAAGYVDHSGEYAWDELRERIQQFEIGKGMPIPGRCVGVDCGYAEKFHREVLMKCHESGTQYKFYDPTIKSRPPMFFKAPRGLCVQVQSDGWFAMRGKPSNKPLGDGKFNHELNTNIEDPYFGTAKAGEVLVEVLEFPSGLFWNHKNNLRQARTKNTYSISPNVEFFPKIYTLDGTVTTDSNLKLADYQKHLNEQFYNEKTGKVEPRHGKGGSQSRAHPYHLDDCENENLALATYNEFFDSNPSKT